MEIEMSVQHVLFIVTNTAEIGPHTFPWSRTGRWNCCARSSRR